MLKIQNVLYFCAGNTCRSPFAEYYSKWLKKTKYREELIKINFDSAGLYHYYEYPQEGTVKYLQSKGIDISDFKAKKIDQDLLSKQDLILGFEEKQHIQKLKRKYKNFQDLDKKVFLILDYAGETENLDILDPFYFEEDAYNEVLKRIELGVEKVIKKIIKVNNQSSQNERKEN
jgi:protein-tyrosine phosphatase